MTTVALHREGLSIFTLKWIALCCMVFDHLAEFFPMQAPLWFHWIGCLAEPIFCFVRRVALRIAKSGFDASLSQKRCDGLHSVFYWNG